MKNRVLIIGNGFDLDLGLITSYKDFYNSRYWPFRKLQNNYESNQFSYARSLNDALLLEKDNNTWFDIEATLGKYACHKRSSEGYVWPASIEQAETDRNQYNILVSSLRSYLQEVQTQSRINSDSIAAEVLRAIITNGYFNKIFTFNYTNLKLIASKLSIENSFDYSHMHGTLDKDIILGIESRMNFDPLYRFMCKEYNPHYETRLLIINLNEASEVVFFGHSLSEIDYHYFRTFFQTQSSDILTKEQSKKISIFTYNIESQWDICDQLRNMNDWRLDSLFGNNDFQIFRTSDCRESGKYAEFLRHLKDTSKGAEREKTRRLASMI